MADQPSLVPSTPDELLEPDHKVRRLWSLIDESAGESLRRHAKDCGGILYDPSRMFAVWMYGLMNGVCSSRALEELCRYDVRYWFLCGGARPDHVTLSRFRLRFEEWLPSLFEEVAAAGRKAGLLGPRPLAIDGTKVAGAHTQWRRALSNASEFDEDASTMKDGHGGFVTGYNAQVAVDTESTFIAGCTVTDEKNDERVLGEVLEAVRSQSGDLPSSVVADTGYDASENHQALSSHRVTGYLKPQESRSTVFSRGADGLLRCRAGHEARLGRTLKKGVAYDVYRVYRCGTCPLRGSCGSGKGRSREMALRSGVSPELRTENAKRCETDEGRRLLRLRGPTVELVFARLKALFGFRRFSLRNLKGTRLEFGLLTLSYNLWLLTGALFAFLRLFRANFKGQTVSTAS
jgi:transposase